MTSLLPVAKQGTESKKKSLVKSDSNSTLVEHILVQGTSSRAEGFRPSRRQATKEVEVAKSNISATQSGVLSLSSSEAVVEFAAKPLADLRKTPRKEDVIILVL